jgi:hypothetical protein
MKTLSQVLQEQSQARQDTANKCLNLLEKTQLLCRKILKHNEELIKENAELRQQIRKLTYQ